MTTARNDIQMAQTIQINEGDGFVYSPFRVFTLVSSGTFYDNDEITAIAADTGEYVTKTLKEWKSMPAFTHIPKIELDKEIK